MENPDQTAPSDSELVRAFAREQSERAFNALVTRHIDLVYSTALRLVSGDPHRASEITQMAFTKLARKAASLANDSRLEKHTTLAGWLYTCTYWAASKLLRAKHRRAKHERAAAKETVSIAQESPSLTESANADWESMRPALDHAIQRLKEIDREAVLLRFFNNLSFAEVGAQLGLSENTARMRVQRALEKLRAQLSRHGITSSAGALGAALTTNAVMAAPAGLAATASVSALSGAAATVSAGILATAGIFIMSKATTVILGISILSLAFFAVSQGGKQRVLAGELTDAKVETENARRLLSDASSRLAQTRDEIAQIGALIAANPDAAAKLEEERKQALRSRGYLDDTFAPLFRKLRLNHEKLALFIDLHREAEVISRKVHTIAVREGVPFIPDEAKDFALQDVYNRMKSLVGDENLEYYKYYIETLLYRVMDSTIERQLQFIDMPITDEQKDALVNIHFEHGGDSLRTFMENVETRVWTDAEVAAAQNVLTPEQFIVLQDSNRAADANNKILELNRKAAEEGRIKSKIREWGY